MKSEVAWLGQNLQGGGGFTKSGSSCAIKGPLSKGLVLSSLKRRVGRVKCSRKKTKKTKIKIGKLDKDLINNCPVSDPA